MRSLLAFGTRSRVLRSAFLALIPFAFAVHAGCARPDPGGFEPAPRAEVAAQKGEAPATKVSIEGAAVMGDKSALVTIVELTDYECPFCARANATMTELRKTYGNKLRVVVRQNPLPFHEHAMPAALAAYAANDQGKFAEMHDLLFKSARALDADGLDRLAKDLGLDLGRFHASMKTAEASVARDLALASELQVKGTPAFFVNGRLLQGAQGVDAFKKVVDAEMAKAEALVKSGVRPENVYDTLQRDAVTPAPVAKLDGQAQAHPHAMDDAMGEPSCNCGSCDQAGAAADVALPTKVEEVGLGTVTPRGSSNAAVTLVVFSDFQCPYCARLEETLKTLESDYHGKVKVAFRNQPLPFHENAKLAAKAALAAQEQGKFWEMHDAIFEHKDTIDRAGLERLAERVGVDMGRWKRDVDGTRLDGVIEADVTEATALHVEGTPTLFINGRRVVGARPVGELKAMIDQAIAAR